MGTLTAELHTHLLEGQVIPAHPLALTDDQRLSERYQRGLTRYYVAAGAGGLAVGVHTTQFAIREHGLYAPVLELASETIDAERQENPRPFVKIAGICGKTTPAIREAETALSFGYHAGLVSLSAFRDESDAAALEHVRGVAETIPVIGFYLQPAVGGRVFGYEFWRRFAEIENVVAVKIAPFNRYQTVDVIRAVIASGRDDIALYTGNDDSIVTDLLTDWEFPGPDGSRHTRNIVGGLLGHWAVDTQRAVELLIEAKASRDARLSPYWLTRAAQITDANAAYFDAANGFAGCIAGIHEVLRRQGLLEGITCLDPHETLSPGQADEITRVRRAYPYQQDDEFIAANRDYWLR
jgi:dihydrodipicolinate synthase/N-acetylneuraminate lyase